MDRDEDFLSRWSRRKRESREPSGENADAARAPDPETPDKRQSGAAAAAEGDSAVKAPLPSVESLTPESDFAPFMEPEVDGDMRRKALKTLFSDPHFNTMDMLDVYVDDFSKPDPIPESWLVNLEQVSRLGDRAGRDREEAERKAALAQSAAEAPESPAAELEVADSRDELPGPESPAAAPEVSDSRDELPGPENAEKDPVDRGDTSAKR